MAAIDKIVPTRKGTTERGFMPDFVMEFFGLQHWVREMESMKINYRVVR